MARRRAGGPRRRPDAFSLLEVVFVTAIIAILAAIAAPRYAAAASRYRVEMAARRIVADLHLIRMRARAQNTYESAKFYTDSEKYQMISDPDLDFPGKEYWVDLSREPYRVDMTAVAFGSGQDYMRYGAYGHPYWGGYVTLKSGDVERTVRVNSNTGKATIE